VLEVTSLIFIPVLLIYELTKWIPVVCHILDLSAQVQSTLRCTYVRHIFFFISTI